MNDVYRKFRLHEMEAGVIVEVGPDGRGREFCSVGNSFGDQRQNAETILRALAYAFSVKPTSTPPTEKSPAERAGTQGNGLSEQTVDQLVHEMRDNQDQRRHALDAKEQRRRERLMVAGSVLNGFIARLGRDVHDTVEQDSVTYADNLIRALDMKEGGAHGNGLSLITPIIEVQPQWGANLLAVCEQAIAFAKEKNSIVRFTFNGTTIEARPSDSAQDMVYLYEAARKGGAQ